MNDCSLRHPVLNYRPQARSSAVEHHVDIVVVGGSTPLAPTNLLNSLPKALSFDIIFA